MAAPGSGVQSGPTADGTFGRQMGNCTTRVDLNGHNFMLDNGGCNTTDLSGAPTCFINRSFDETPTKRLRLRDSEPNY